MKKEIFDAQIPGFDGYTIRKDGVVVGRQNRPLNPFIDRDGYCVVSLLNGGKASKRFVHRLVAQAFIPNPENKSTVNHINGNKTDNRVENLEWATQSENNAHAYRTELATPHRINGDKNGRSKLTREQVEEIRTQLATDNSSDIRDLAKAYGVSERIIKNIKDNKTYKTSLQ